MKNYTCSLTEPQIDWLRAEAGATGLNISEIVRRALDDYRRARDRESRAVVASRTEVE